MNSLKLNSLITALVVVFSLSAFAEDKKANAPAAGDSDKLDIQKLEQKYWSAKDDDFSVIQNRAFAKEKRWYLSLNYGTPYNDPNYVGNAIGLNVGYFFNERWGLELNYVTTGYRDNDTVSEYKNTYGAMPDHNRLVGATTLMAYWVPIYAKMSLLDKKIIYFDMGLGFGFGNTSYAQQKCATSAGCTNLVWDSVDAAKTAPHYSINIFQQFFISNHMAFRFDFMNRWTNEERLSFKNGTSVGNKTTNDTIIQIGLTFWK